MNIFHITVTKYYIYIYWSWLYFEGSKNIIYSFKYILFIFELRQSNEYINKLLIIYCTIETQLTTLTNIELKIFTKWLQTKAFLIISMDKKYEMNKLVNFNVQILECIQY